MSIPSSRPHITEIKQCFSPSPIEGRKASFVAFVTGLQAFGLDKMTGIACRKQGKNPQIDKNESAYLEWAKLDFGKRLLCTVRLDGYDDEYFGRTGLVL